MKTKPYTSAMWDADCAALAILSEAKTAALDAILTRQEATARWVYKDEPEPTGPSLYDTLEAWRLVTNAWSRLNQKAFANLLARYELVRD